jgi:hypothetical protein
MTATKKLKQERFDILTAMSMRMAVFRDVALCKLADIG